MLYILVLIDPPCLLLVKFIANLVHRRMYRESSDFCRIIDQSEAAACIHLFDFLFCKTFYSL